MKIAHIVPPAWEGSFKVTEYRMALAHWALEYPGYALKVRKAAEYVILDNGAFEGQPVTRAELAKAADAVDADEVVLPDVLGESKKTLQTAWAALGHVATSRVMFVPQGRTLEEWSGCLVAWLNKWESNSWRNDYVLTIGITSLRHVKGTNRVQLLSGLEEVDYPIHLLGVSSPSEFALKELLQASKLGVRGVDTSTAFALGARGILVSPTSKKVHLGDPKQYEKLDTFQRRLIELNMKILEEWVFRGEGSEKISTYLIRNTASAWLKYYAEGFAELDVVMKACGMPVGKYALLKVRRREIYVRPLARFEKLEENEVLVEVKK